MTDHEYPATEEGGHALVIEYGDCELIAHCMCGVDLGRITPDKSLDTFSTPWERHVMGLGR